MKRTWKKVLAFVCAFTLVAAPAAFNGNSMWSGADGTIVSAAENSTDYTITIPATLSVANAGWNAATPITAKVKEGDTFDSSKQLMVTASSKNEWNLKSGENLIAYKIASATEQDKSYSDATAITSLKISADQLNNGTYSAPFGIIVDDYSNKAAGTYQDVVTFTASVEDAVKTFNSADVTAGTILHVGDKIEVGSKMLDFDGWSLPANNTYTLVRVNATEVDHSMAMMPDITESDDGAYYTFKYILDGETKYQPKYVMPQATSTSDGVIVVKDTEKYFPELCAHEP